MRRLLILLTLPILACGGLAESVVATITPQAAPTIVAPPPTESPPTVDSATEPPVI